MISAYDFTLTGEDGAYLPYDGAYRLYAWLLSHLTQEQGEALHEQGEHPISQYLRADRTTGSVTWHVSLLDDFAHALFCPILDGFREISLHTGILSLQAREHHPPTEPWKMICAGRQRDVSRVTLQLQSPTTFKQAKRYVLFPQERLIVQSLVNQWNRFCTEYPLDDEDAFQMLTDGIAISEYSLCSTRYHLKETALPCFMGRVTLSAHLSPPMAELWGALLIWAEYSGLGIKTTLGMGGIKTGFRNEALT